MTSLWLAINIEDQHLWFGIELFAFILYFCKCSPCIPSVFEPKDCSFQTNRTGVSKQHLKRRQASSTVNQFCAMHIGSEVQAYNPIKTQKGWGRGAKSEIGKWWYLQRPHESCKMPPMSPLFCLMLFFRHFRSSCALPPWNRNSIR